MNIQSNQSSSSNRYFIIGLWCMVIFVLFLALGSIIQAWNRPVSVLSNIPNASPIIDHNGYVKHPSRAIKYFDPELRQGDQILKINDKDWPEALHLNLHELPDDENGSMLDLMILREKTGIEEKVQFELKESSLWERLWLMRYGIAGLITWLVPFSNLTLLQRRQKRQSGLRTFFSMNNVIDWNFGWLLLSIGLSVSGYKYPITVTIGDALAPVIALYIGSISLPYPFSNRVLRSRWLFRAMNGLGIATMCLVLWSATQITISENAPFDSLARLSFDDKIPLTNVSVLWVSQIVSALGFAGATLGILILTFFQKIIRSEQQLEYSLRYVPRALEDRVLNVYHQLCREQPTNIHIVAIFQILIIMIYLVQDVIPRVYGYPTVGYSILIALIPVSYLFFYATPFLQSMIKRTWLFITATIVPLQLISIYFYMKDDSWGWAGDFYIITLFVFISGLVIGLPMAFYLQEREPDDKILRGIRNLFACTDQVAFWERLIRYVGPSIGVNTWLWISKSQNHDKPSTEYWPAVDSLYSQWEVQYHTSNLSPEWLTQSLFTDIFYEMEKTGLHSIILPQDPFPLFIMAFPIHRGEQGPDEYLFAFNPSLVKDKVLLNNSTIINQITQAVNILHNRKELELTALQNSKEVEALSLRLMDEHQKDKHDWSMWIHNHPLQDLYEQGGELEKLGEILMSQGEILAAIKDRSKVIHKGLRYLSNDMKPPGIDENLQSTLEEELKKWMKKYPNIFFRFKFEGENQLLTQDQTSGIFQIIKPAVDNAINHANCTEIEILVDIDEEQMKAQVKDNGSGFDINKRRSGATGIKWQEIRAKNLGGQLSIDTQLGAGCRVVFTLPLGNS